jgi:hypothetical protein
MGSKLIGENQANISQGYTVFSIPVGVVYRPNQAKVKNLKTKDYLGKARLVAASDRSNAFTGFAGSEIKNVSSLQTFCYSADNSRLVNLTSRTTDPLRLFHLLLRILSSQVFKANDNSRNLLLIAMYSHRPHRLRPRKRLVR